MAATSMHAFEVLGAPVRRRIVKLLAQGEKSSGEIVAFAEREFRISQSAVSQHLRVLRENGFATVRGEGARRVYSLDAGPFREIDEWLESFRSFWKLRLDALDAEVERGKREK